MSVNARRGGTKTLSVPRQLATTTDLKPGDVQVITEAINPLIADAFAL